MISLKAVLGYLLLLGTATKISAFDPNICDVYVFRTTENALWHCGPPLPEEPTNPWTALYCDAAPGEGVSPFAWASDHPDDWCAFMVATVRNGGIYPLTPEIGFSETPGPNVHSLHFLVDWSCYVIEDGATKEAYYVNPTLEGDASTVTDQCERTKNYFDYWVLFDQIRNLGWRSDEAGTIYPGWTGFLPDKGKFVSPIGRPLLYSYRSSTCFSRLFSSRNPSHQRL